MRRSWCGRRQNRLCATSSRSSRTRASRRRKVQFLLDATLGFINLAQNDIIKLFSVLAVIFMPPTMIASIYGMNFKVMPELEWPWGYPAALVLMVLVAVGPYVFFRWKKWL
ncbi:MAG: CorA family divalent cation transporter [Roseiarcus sp.]